MYKNVIIIKNTVPPQALVNINRFWLSCFRLLCFLAPKTFNLFSATILWSMPEEGYSRNARVPLI